MGHFLLVLNSIGKIMSKKTIRDPDPTIKVTYLKKFWGIRLFTPDGKLHSEEKARTKRDIGKGCRELLRWYDKMGSSSKMASASRHRNKVDK